MNSPTIKWLFFSFKGRIARQSFLLSVFMLFLPQFYIFSRIMRLEENSTDAVTWGLIWLAILVFTLWSALALTIKRLHDLSLPSFLAILMTIPTINFLTFLVLAVMPSKNESNQHGPPPFGARENKS